MNEEKKVTCPNCQSDQIDAVRKGFSGGKALAGAALVGGIGILAGTHGSKKVNIVCLNCGTEWDPSVRYEREQKSIQNKKWEASLAELKKSGAMAEGWENEFLFLYREGRLVDALEHYKTKEGYDGRRVDVTTKYYQIIVTRVATKALGWSLILGPIALIVYWLFY